MRRARWPTSAVEALVHPVEVLHDDDVAARRGRVSARMPATSSKSFSRRALGVERPDHLALREREVQQRVEERAELDQVGQALLQVRAAPSRCAARQGPRRAIPRIECSASTQGVNGAACRCSKQAARVTLPASRMPRRASSSRRVLPTPASPSTRSARPAPLRASSHARPISSSSARRPNRRPCDVPRSGAAADLTAAAPLLLQHADADRLLLALDLDGLEHAGAEVGADVVQQVAADERLARLRRAHQPRRQVHRIAHDRVLAAERAGPPRRRTRGRRSARSCAAGRVRTAAAPRSGRGRSGRRWPGRTRARPVSRR